MRDENWKRKEERLTILTHLSEYFGKKDIKKWDHSRVSSCYSILYNRITTISEYNIIESSLYYVNELIVLRKKRARTHIMIWQYILLKYYFRFGFTNANFSQTIWQAIIFEAKYLICISRLSEFEISFRISYRIEHFQVDTIFVL